MPNKSKDKGNRQERTIARVLSRWFFGDPDLLWRDSSSGARKYRGDIVPYKPIPWLKWPFLIEVKYGYKNKMPKGLSYPKIVEEWVDDSIAKLNDEQKYLILMIKFHRREDILATVHTDLITGFNPYAVFFLKNRYNLLIYDFFEMIKKPFNEVFNKDFIQEVSRS